MQNKGFTLIEILIVIVIIGITVGFALISFGDFGQGRSVLFSAEQLANTLQLAQQQAILEANTLGLRIDNNGYQILKFQERWKPISNKGIFKVIHFPKNTLVNLKTTNHPPIGTPSIILYASGDMTPFTLILGTPQEHVIATIKGHHNGNIQINPVKKQ